MPHTLANPSPGPHEVDAQRPHDGSVAFGDYRLVSQLGAGPDGVRYRAVEDRTGKTVELVTLSDSRPSGRAERFKRLHTAALLRHPSARQILDLRLEGTRPFLVLEVVETYPGHASRRQALAAAYHLATGLAEAHRLGLAHEHLCPAALYAGREGPKIDWTGLGLDAGRDRPPDPVFLAPERRCGGGPGPAADVYALGALLSGWTDGSPDDLIERLVLPFCADEPLDRPSAVQAAHRLAGLLVDRTLGDGAGVTSADISATIASGESLQEASRIADGAPRALGDRLGRFQLREKLGEGGMGAVYRAEDVTDGSIVALKVLRDSWSQRPEALVRLLKEARLLAEANNPFVANLIEVNEDNGIYYLALEYVAGPSLAYWLGGRNALSEAVALSIVADVARGLAVAHERGIIHRDIKPENILLVDSAEAPEEAPRVKLSDFGLARHVDESESLNVTRAGAVLGTPLYMAPEQSAGTEALGPPADVYALGAVLFRLLAGRPPFEASTVLGVITKHQSEPPPALRTLNPAVSDGVDQVVAKALAKRPGERYADAAALLLDVERLLRGEPTGIGVHPKLPQCEPRDLLRFDFQWELEASPRQLWPYVSNTERLNRALGLPAVRFTTEFDASEGVQRFGQFRTSGIPVGWREHPYEWVEGRRMGVLREFHQGPFLWFVSQVELTPRTDGGTTLSHGIRVAARGLLGRTLAHVKLGKQARRSMDQVYRRIDAALTGKLGDTALADPFEAPPALSDRRRQRLEQWLAALGRHGIEPSAVERLGDFLALAPAQEVARIRPIALARRLGLEPDQVAAACLLGAKDGALLMLWDLLCPVCRIPSQVVDTLRALREHGHCEACRLDYELDFAHSVELIFRAHPDVRETELGTYCIGGPAHSPHVVAQVRVGPGERVALDLALGEGSYRVRGPQLAFSWDFRAEPGAPLKQWEIVLGRGPGTDPLRALRSDEQHLELANDTDRELVVRVERTAARDDAFTAARASALALFRELFPGEVLAPGQVVNLATVTLLVTEPARAGDIYEELGDAKAFALVHEHFRRLDDCVKRHGGTLIKTIQEGSVSAFNDPLAAVRAALELTDHRAGDEAAEAFPIRVGVHHGPAMVATLNDHLDYFGAVVSTALRLPALAPPGGLVLTQPVAADAGVAAILRNLGLVPAVIPASFPGLDEDFVLRLGA
ncbi:MAG: protein kinase [Isosphaeraceae bacterium]|nr:protein kinase [Isosphaeraceae bacterium]